MHGLLYVSPTIMGMHVTESWLMVSRQLVIVDTVNISAAQCGLPHPSLSPTASVSFVAYLLSAYIHMERYEQQAEAHTKMIPEGLTVLKFSYLIGHRV